MTVPVQAAQALAAERERVAEVIAKAIEAEILDPFHACRGEGCLDCVRAAQARRDAAIARGIGDGA